MPIPLAVPLAIAGAQLLGGVVGKIFGKKRPKYEISQGARQSVALAAIDAGSPFAPGYEQARAGLDIASSNALNAASQSGLGASSTLGSIVGAQEAGIRNLAGQNAQYAAGARQRYQSALAGLGEKQDLKYQINEFAPHAERQQLFSDMIGAGFKNLVGGLGAGFAAEQAGGFGKGPAPGQEAMLPLQKLSQGTTTPLVQSSTTPTLRPLPPAPGFDNMYKDYLRSQYLNVG